MSAEQLLKADVSQQERIRLLFRAGWSRSQVAKALGVRYQVVFRATNPKYAPKRWHKVLEHRLAEERAARAEAVAVEEVPLP